MLTNFITLLTLLSGPPVSDEFQQLLQRSFGRDPSKTTYNSRQLQQIEEIQKKGGIGWVTYTTEVTFSTQKKRTAESVAVRAAKLFSKRPKLIQKRLIRKDAMQFLLIDETEELAISCVIRENSDGRMILNVIQLVKRHGVKGFFDSLEENVAVKDLTTRLITAFHPDVDDEQIIDLIIDGSQRTHTDPYSKAQCRFAENERTFQLQVDREIVAVSIGEVFGGRSALPVENP